MVVWIPGQTFPYLGLQLNYCAHSSGFSPAHRPAVPVGFPQYSTSAASCIVELIYGMNSRLKSIEQNVSKIIPVEENLTHLKTQILEIHEENKMYPREGKKNKHFVKRTAILPTWSLPPEKHWWWYKTFKTSKLIPSKPDWALILSK